MSDYYRYTISGSTADGFLDTPLMTQQAERGYISVDFFSDVDLKTVVTPTSGIITFTASETDVNFGSIEDGEVTASNTDYSRPNFSGSVQTVRATMNTIVGADFFKATIHRYKG